MRDWLTIALAVLVALLIGFLGGVMPHLATKNDVSTASNECCQEPPPEPEPEPEPEPPPDDCEIPEGYTVDYDDSYPLSGVNSQLKEIARNQVWAIKQTAPTSEMGENSARFVPTSTTGAWALMTISQCPGDMRTNVINNLCWREGSEGSRQIAWGVDNARYCSFPEGGDFYVNVAHMSSSSSITTCQNRSACGVIVSVN